MDLAYRGRYNLSERDSYGTVYFSHAQGRYDIAKDPVFSLLLLNECHDTHDAAVTVILILLRSTVIAAPPLPLPNSATSLVDRANLVEN